MRAEQATISTEATSHRRGEEGGSLMDAANLARQADIQLDRHGAYDSLYFEGQWFSNAETADRAARLGAGLVQLGLRPGDRLVVVMANCPEVLITYTAVWRAGGVVTPLIFLVSVDELRHALVDSGAVGIITTAEFLSKVTAAAEGVPGLRFVVVAGEQDAESAAAVPVLDFDDVAGGQPGTIVDRAADDDAALLYTGGTTGRAKGVPLTHAHLLWAGSAGHESSHEPATQDATILVPLPLAHAYGLLTTCAGLRQTERHRMVLMRWFDPAQWVELAQRHRVQRSSLVPSMIQMLLPQPLEQADLSALTAVFSGAAPLAAEVRERFEACVPSATIYEGYGCTESAAIISANPLGARRPGSVGLPVTGCAVTIRDEANQPLPPGHDGEICVRSPGVMSGYWRDAEHTATTLVDGWLHTGDIGRVDADGYLYVVDRKKDLIIRGGFNVYPRDVEEVLLGHPAVAMAGVVGRPDARLGEEIVAFVSLHPEATATADELIGHAKQHLAATKYPREITILPGLPLTSVGKLDRKRLRSLVRAEPGAQHGGNTETGAPIGR